MNRFKSKLVNDYFSIVEKQIIGDLSSYGNKFINDAYNSKKWKNRTFNLHDSFGYAVYEDGILKKKGYIGSAEATESNKGQSGRQSIDDYFNGYKSNSLFELVIAVSMSYGKSLEMGETPTGKVYKVISQVFSDVSNLSNDIKGSKMKVIGL